MAEEPKELSNPYSTGSGGAMFETRIQAAFASLMLTKGVSPCLPAWPVYKIKLQGKYSGYATDDVLVFVKDEPTRREAKLIAQIKHAPSITVSDKVSAEVIQNAWQDFKNPDLFNETYDKIALITGPLSATDTYDVRDMLEMARTALNGEDFFDKIKLAKFSSTGKQEKLKVFRHHLKVANKGNEPDETTIWNFLKSFHLLGYDLDIKQGTTLSLLQSLIGTASQGDAEKIWLKILDEVQHWNSRAGVMTLENLPTDLLDYFQIKLPPTMPAMPAMNGIPIPEMIAATLMGAWDEKSTGDREAVETLTGTDFASWQNKIREVWLTTPGVFEQKDGKWRVADRRALWNSEGPRINDDQLDKFKNLAVTVLSEIHPALELDPEERYAASIHGKVQKYSSELRKGMADTAALLGVYPAALTTSTQGKPESLSFLVVKECLAGGDWKRWASLNDVLPVLAEASPNAFLEGIDAAFQSSPELFPQLFAQETAGIAGRNYITGLLWGLESLAWSPAYVVAVVRILTDLASVDPGGNWANRPGNSLREILLPWMPQTCADTEKRHAAAKVATKEKPEVGWKLLLALLPESHSAASTTHRPRWRELIDKDWQKGASQSQYWEDVIAYSKMALAMTDRNTVRLADLIKRYFKLPADIQGEIRALLASPTVTNLPDDERSALWNALSTLTNNYRKFGGNENWNAPESALEELESIADRLRPTAPEVKHKRLFGADEFNLYDDQGTFDEQRQRLVLRRKEAVNEIMEAGGLPLLLKFAAEVSASWQVGYVLGLSPDYNVDADILPELLSSDSTAVAQFAGGYIAGRFSQLGWPWVDGLLQMANWQAKNKGLFFTFLPFQKATWERVEKHLLAEESEYWSRAVALPFDVGADLNFALNKLVDFGRADAAIRCVQGRLEDENIDPHIVLRVLNSIKKENQIDGFAIGRLIQYLQKSLPVDSSELRATEWNYIPLLGEHGLASPVALSRWLAEDPNVFCDVIQMIFKSKKGETEPELSDELKAKAQNAYRLLMNWKIPPGTLRAGTYSVDALKDWVEKVKNRTTESGHWEVACSQIGEVLFYAPRDEHGVWIEGVCEVLDEPDNGRIRSGLTTEIFNSRGVFTFSAGQAETELADQWVAKASRVENNGFSRLAQDLRRISESYRHMATRESNHDPLD